MVELKPCPFCGGKADFEFKGFIVGRVQCTECLVSQCLLKPIGEAAKAWNRRAEDGK